ncbi:MAG: SusC/RagA family TonB-linked outer membrane protein [Sphingobacteriales bacterium]|nr:SusC/RagA family TonB-linked outer membrane protein [Sphingobacteriales bacterium]
MKLITVLLVAACLQVSASGYSQKVTIKGENLTLRKVFDEIRKQTGFHFFYADEILSTAKNVTVDIKKAEIDEALDYCFRDQDLSYTISENTIIVRRKVYTPEPVVADPPVVVPAEVKGKVTDEKGQPVVGASVVNERTKRGTTTDANGNFSIQAEKNDMLTFSYVGKAQQTVKVTDVNTAFTISLKDAVVTNENIVVTALGIRREEKALGYSVQKVSGENLQRVSGVDVATSLTGKVAGLLVKNSSDFAVIPDLTIRGEKPLLVVDGIAYANKTLSDISSEDIESITVLKGATASALYGYRGTNGALLITTKNGSTNKEGVTVDFATNTMFTAGFLAIPEKQTVYGRGSNNTYNKNSDAAWGAKMDGAIQNQWDPKLMDYRDYEYLPVGRDNFHNFLEQGYVSNNNLNIGYRKDNVALRSSFNWTQNKGQYPNSTLDKYSYTFGGDFNFNKFRLSSNVSYARKHTPNMGSNGYTSYDPMYSLLIWSGADYDIRDYKNNYWLKKDQVQNFTYRSGSNNPYFDRYERTNEVTRDLFNADVSMNYQVTSWLKASVRSGLDFYIDRADQRVSWGSYTSTGNTPIPGNPYTWNGAWTGGYNTGRNSGSSINTDVLFTGDRSYKQFRFEYLAGGTIFFKRDDNMYAQTVGGISVPGFFSIKASVNSPSVSQSTAAQQVNSLFGRVGVSWKKMIFVEATGRNDWSSTLPKSTRSYFYPSVASSFVVSELLPDTRNWLDFLKVRTSWNSSKEIPGIYAINSSFSINSSTWGTMNGATAPSNIYATGQRPVSNNTFETGLQAMFLKNRLMADVSYYTKRTFDRLAYSPITAAAGYTSAYINIKEELTRKGWELILNGTPVKNGDWQWDLGLNWTTFKRFITRIDSNFSAKKPWVYKDARYDVLYSKAFLRSPSGELIFNNGRLQYAQYDSKFGYTDPDWIWGINSNLRYKNFSLYLSVDGVKGGLMNTRTESYMWQSGVHPGSLTRERELDVATPGSKNFLGQGVKVVSGTATYDAMGNITSDTRVFAPNDVYTTYKQYAIDLHNSSAWGGNGSSADTYSKTFLKLREISLTYTFPGKYLKGWAKAASVSFVGQNVLLKAKDFKYSDPDGGVEDFSDPSVRYLGVNIKLTF